MDPYKILKVNECASYEDLKRALKKASVRYHPDKVTDIHLKKKNEEKFKLVRNAYDDIMTLRKSYNIKSKPNFKRGAYVDMLYNMYPPNELFEPAFLDPINMKQQNNAIFDEMEERMKTLDIKISI